MQLELIQPDLTRPDLMLLDPKPEPIQPDLTWPDLIQPARGHLQRAE